MDPDIHSVVMEDNAISSIEATSLPQLPSTTITTSTIPILGDSFISKDLEDLDNALSPSSRLEQSVNGNLLKAESPIYHDQRLESPLQSHSVFVSVPPRFNALPHSTLRSGLIYDRRMRFHQDPQPFTIAGAHPEDPRRILEIYNELVDAGLTVDDERDGEDIGSSDQLLKLVPRAATIREIELVHSLKHVNFIKDLAGYPIDHLKRLEDEINNSVYFNNLSWLSSSIAAGCAIEATEAVLVGHVKNAVAVIRPPGHHAEPPEPENEDHHEPGGFCVFNNVSIATRVIQRKHPELCRKVFILDWDVHHGNGLQKTFYDDPNVLYISIHRYENAQFYPHDKIGDYVACGTGKGLGRNVNIPWPHAHMTDADYLYAFQQVVMPIAIEFDPDLVIIAAGFDAADGDFLGECHVSPAGYAHMTHMLMRLAGGKIVACLEGGYNCRSIAKSFLAMTRTLMGEPPDRLGDLKPHTETLRTMQDVIRVQSSFWKCLFPKELQRQRQQKLGSERLHDVVRQWSSQKFFDEFQMSRLYILHQTISKSLDDQVLATMNYGEARPLLVIFHDPPEAVSYPNPLTNELELHNTFLTDVSKSYIAWAIKHDFAVIDVNIPKHLTDPQDTKGFAASESHHLLRDAAKRVARYLWRNYIEVGDSTHIFLMGIGDSFGGILDLFGEYGSSLYRTDLTIGFVATSSLPKLSRDLLDDNAPGKYFRNSLVYVSHEHDAWDEGMKLRKRHGNLQKSPQTTIQDMLYAHRDEVKEVLFTRTAAWRAEHTDMQHSDLRQTSEMKVTVTTRDAELNSDDPDAEDMVLENSQTGSSFKRKDSNSDASKALRSWRPSDVEAVLREYRSLISHNWAAGSQRYSRSETPPVLPVPASPSLTAIRRGSPRLTPRQSRRASPAI